MDDAGRYTAEHTLMDANLEVSKLKHLLEVAEDKIRELEKQLAEKDNIHCYVLDVTCSESIAAAKTLILIFDLLVGINHFFDQGVTDHVFFV